MEYTFKMKLKKSTERFKGEIIYELLFGILGEFLGGGGVGGERLKIVELFLKTLFQDLCSTGKKKSPMGDQKIYLCLKMTRLVLIKNTNVLRTYSSQWMIAQMVERLLCQIPAPAPYEITLY